MSTEGNYTRKNFLLVNSRAKVVIYGLFTTARFLNLRLKSRSVNDQLDAITWHSSTSWRLSFGSYVVLRIFAVILRTKRGLVPVGC